MASSERSAVAAVLATARLLGDLAVEADDAAGCYEVFACAARLLVAVQNRGYGAYIGDSEEALAGGLPGLYHVEDTWANSDAIAPVVSRRYAEWRAARASP